MQNFSQIAGLVLEIDIRLSHWPYVECRKYPTFWLGQGALPCPRSVEQIDGLWHLAATALRSISWYTSSKGMPRHAHGRGALINMGALI